MEGVSVPIVWRINVPDNLKITCMRFPCLLEDLWGTFCTLICCLINGNAEDSMPLAVAMETEVDSDQVTIYDMRPAYSSDEEDL